jgi:type VI secretion system secreted protein VgrG
MAEFDKIRGLLTGRQSAHLTIIRRESRRERDGEKVPPAPEVSVVSWSVREEICEPYRARVIVTAPTAISRKHILGRPARFTVEPEDGRGKREYRGFVIRFDAVSESRDICTYEVVFKQHLAILDGALNCATYQNQASWEIIREVIGRHDLKFHMQVEFNLRREHSRHAFRFQYNLTDWSFVQLMMEQAGLYCYTKAGEYGDVLVFADDLDGYMRPSIKVRDRPSSGLLTFEESIYSFKVHTRSVPKAFAVADFNPQAAHERIREEASALRDDETMQGSPYIWGTHHLNATGAKHEATLRHEAAIAHQVEYRVKSTILEARPGQMVETDRLHEDAPHGMVITRVVHRGARDQSYSNSIRAIPADRAYRMRIDESRWPRIQGTLGATICSPDSYKFGYLTENGEYVARLHCDYGNWPKGGESVPLRLAKPFAGRDHTGLHMPALDGDEAEIAFRDGSPNKPYIAGFHHNSTRPDLINSTRRRMSRNEMRTQSGNKLWMDDWDDQEGIELSTEHSGRSQLNLGFIPDGELNKRGAGAEIRTSGHAVTRGGAGVMVSAYDQPGGNGKQLSMAETVAQLKEMLALAESLAQSAEASKASPADTNAQRAINDDLNELRKSGVIVTAPGPVGVVSGDGMQLAADGSIIATAKKGVHFSTLKRFTVAARDLVSVFTQKGMSLIAAAGAVVVQAQRGPMQLASQEDMTVETVNGVVHVKSPKEIVLNVGGSYFRMTPDGIEMGTRGAILFKTSRLKKAGPAQMDLGGAAFAPKFVPFTTDCEVWRTNSTFVEQTALTTTLDAERRAGLANTGAVPPAPAVGDSSMMSAGGNPWGSGLRQTGSNPPGTRDVVNGLLVLDDPENAPPNFVSDHPEPVKLQKPASCNWILDDFNIKARLLRETPVYHQYGDTRNAPLQDNSGHKRDCSGTATTVCQLNYDSKNKTLIAKVVVALVPRLLVKMNVSTRQPLLDGSGNYIEVNYQSTENGANSGKTFAELGLMQIDRDVSTVNASKYKNLIETTLNQGNYELILDGCSKGTACGCRVSVKFCVDIHVVSPPDAVSLNANATINLLPKTDRADAAHWPETEYRMKDGRLKEMTTQVKAHETGHLFAFPDEYWNWGGFVDKQYVKNDKTLNFELGDKNAATSNTWQLSSEPNLMGYGCHNSTATVRPYYLEPIRQWFSIYTNRKWRVGYANKN